MNSLAPSANGPTACGRQILVGKTLEQKLPPNNPPSTVRLQNAFLVSRGRGMAVERRLYKYDIRTTSKREREQQHSGANPSPDCPADTTIVRHYDTTTVPNGSAVSVSHGPGED